MGAGPGVQDLAEEVARAALGARWPLDPRAALDPFAPGF